MGQQVYNYEPDLDTLHVTAHVAMDGTVVSNSNPLRVQPTSSTNLTIFNLVLADNADTRVHADLACIELVIQNETGSDVMWGEWGGTSLVTLHSGDVAGLPVANANQIQARMEAAAGAGTVVVVVRH